jgi:hypothetical protein
MVKGLLTPSPMDAIGTPAYLVKRCLTATDVDGRRVTQPPFEGRDNGNWALVTKILGTRQNVSMDNLLEYRVEVCPSQLAELALSGIKEKRPDSAGNSAAFDDELIEDSLQVKKKTPKGFPPDCNMPVFLDPGLYRPTSPPWSRN